MKIKRMYCQYCREQTKHVFNGTSIFGHVLLTIILGGFWLVILPFLWMIGFEKDSWACDRCGGDYSPPGRTRNSANPVLTLFVIGGGIILLLWLVSYFR